MATVTFASGLVLVLLSIHNAEAQSADTLRVVSAISEPFLMKIGSDASGKDQYEGYAKDLTDLVSGQLGRPYEMSLSADGSYGMKKEGNRWSGMVGEVVSGQKDIIIADLTVTSAREEVIEYSQPFMIVGLSLMMGKQQSASLMESNLSYWTLLTVFSCRLWLAIFASYLITTGLVLILTRIADKRAAEGSILPTTEPTKESSQNFNENSKDTLKRLLAKSSLAVLTLDLAQRSKSSKPLSVKILIGAMLLFSVFITAAYISNLTVTLAMHRQSQLKIQSIDDLIKQLDPPGREVDVEFGLLRGGSAEAFFRESPIPGYRRIWEYLETHPDLYVSSLREGYARLRDANRPKPFVLILESTQNDYITGHPPCDTVRVGDSHAYALAVAKGSPLVDPLNWVVIKLQETGEVHKLKRKWFSSECEADQHSFIEKGSPQPLGLDHMTVSFVLVANGMLAAIAASLVVTVKDRRSSSSA